MKIEATFALPGAPPPPATQPVGPAFNDLLTVSEPLDDGAHAAGFQALGMFGRHGATAATSEEPPSPSLTVPAAPPATSHAQPKVVSAAPPPSSTFHSAPSRHTPGAVSHQTAVSRFARQDHTGPVSGDAMSAPENTAQGDEPGVGGASRRRTPAHSPHQTWRVNLGKAGEPDAAALIVRAAGLDPQEIAEFRARAQILLRERGLALDKVRINGEDHPAVEAPGGGPQAWR